MRKEDWQMVKDRTSKAKSLFFERDDIAELDEQAYKEILECEKRNAPPEISELDDDNEFVF